MSTDLGPLHYIAQAISDRLKLVFPERIFTHEFVPGKMDKAEWNRLVRRMPFIGIAWNGISRDRDNGRIFEATANWSVLLVTKNEFAKARLFGDALGVGLFELTHVATAVLHGWTVNPDGTPWEAQGTTMVMGVANHATPEWVAEHTGIAEITVAVPFELSLPAVLALDGDVGSLITIASAWNFNEPDSPADTLTLEGNP